MRKIRFAVALLFCISLCQCEAKEPEHRDPIVAGTIEYKMVDKNATEATKTLLDNLRLLPKKGVILGQQQAYIERKNGSGSRTFSTDTDICRTTQRQPMFTGEDLLNLTDDDNNFQSTFHHKQVTAIKEWVKECHKMGVFVTFSWHFREPYEGNSFYTKDMTEEAKEKAFKSILEGGENHEYYKKKLDIVADFFKSLESEDGELIPIIFRPFHEMGGAWFWWGIPHYGTTAEYIQNWRFTVEYLRDKHQVHNLIYAFSPDKNFLTTEEYQECYPGDEYVDIVGWDCYENYSKGKVAENTTKKQIGIVSDFAKKHGKVAALTECGYSSENGTIDDLYKRIYLNFMTETEHRISYMMFWYNNDEKYFLPDDRASDAERVDFTTFVNHDKILMQGDITSPLVKSAE